MKQIGRIEKYIELIKQYPHITTGADELKIITDKPLIYDEQYKMYKYARENKLPEYWYDLGIVAEDAWVLVIRDLVRFPNGRYGGYIRTINRKSQLEQSGKDTVVLVKINNEFLLQKHFRHDDRMWHWECPRGFGEQGLTPEENAVKEIEEETGLTVKSIRQLDADKERVAYFIANCTGEISNSDKTESITSFMLIDKDEFKNMIATCKIDDMYTIRAFMLYELCSE